MIRQITRLAVATLMGIVAINASAVPAKPGPVTMTFPDGSTMEVTIHGDEHFNFYMTPDGRMLHARPDGYLYYLDTDAESGKLRITDVRAHDAAHRTQSELTLLRTIDNDRVVTGLQMARAEALTANRQLRTDRQAKVVTGESILTDYPTIGSPNALILLVEFPDERFHTPNAHEEFQRLMMERGYDYNGATGSARDFYEENSMGLFKPNFQVYGPVCVPNNMAYYGAPNGSAYDTAAWEMVSDAVAVLKAQQPELDMSQFDNDHDGYVDNIFVFYAGYGQNSGASVNTIWPHAANLSWYGLAKEYDGVRIDNYACSNELQGTSGTVRAGIGTFCHEFGHVLGLPDLYSTDYSNAFTPGSWELMDVGSYNNNGNTPPYMSSYDRMSLRWLNPRELTAPETVTLRHLGTHNEAFLIKTAKEEEYYLFENRQLTGWDAYLPGHGMLVWHIDFDPQAWKLNTVNNVSNHQRVDIVEADNTKTNESRGGDTFPGRSGITDFTDDTTPPMASWTGIRVGKPITDIREIDGTISFKVLGGGEGIPTPTATEATDVTPVAFTANWLSITTISNYEIDLCRTGEVMPILTVEKASSGSADCFYRFTDLTPETSYYYVVRAIDGTMKSPNSNSITVTTLPPTFDMLQTVATEATDITDGSFTANWSHVAGADDYLLSVYRKEFVRPIYDVANFDGGLTGIPEGWTTSASSTSAVAGTFGAARPSLLMKTNYDYIASSVYDYDINELSLWYRGNSSIDGSMTIEGMFAGAWKTLAEVNVTGVTTGTTLTLGADTTPAMLPGCRAIRISFIRTAGSLYIDDVSVAYKGAADLLYVRDYSDKSVGYTDSHAIDGLGASTTYYYTVTALNGSTRAIASAEKTLTTAASAGIDDVAADSNNLPTRYFNLQGIEIPANRLVPGLYIRRQGNSASKILVK